MCISKRPVGRYPLQSGDGPEQNFWLLFPDNFFWVQTPTCLTPGETPGEPGKHPATPAASCTPIFSDESRTWSDGESVASC